MARGHDLGGTPGLVNAQIGDDIRRLETTVSAAPGNTAPAPAPETALG